MEQQRFREAVERRSRDAEVASRACLQDEEAAVQGDQEGLRSPSQPQDAFSAGGENAWRTKVTAPTWNQ
jgi:hypothetical protein